MTTMDNQAVWLAAKGDHGSVGPAPLKQPGPDQLLIRNRAVAMNPVDWKIRDDGIFMLAWPAILGCDLAGDIVEVGPTTNPDDKHNFNVGQRVMSHALFLQYGDFSQAAFQKYTIVSTAATAPLPDNIDYASGSVLPLSVNTAVAGLYTAAHLNLPLPKATSSITPLNKTILIWGGSGSVGASAVQLAAASGLTVISTSSPHNFTFVKSLGATHVLDYNHPEIVPQLISLLQNTSFAGAFDATGSAASALPVAQIVSELLGGGKVPSALATTDAVPGVTGQMVMAPSAVLAPNEHVGRAVWRDFLPEALRTGQMKAAPRARVVGRGLGDVPRAIEEMKGGVSAEKLVVEL